MRDTPYTPNNPSDDLFYIGRQINDNAGSVLHQTHFNGSIDDIRIYDRKLTQAEISVLHNEDGYPGKVITDIDGNSYNTVRIE
ncbi:MAG: LamG domain-containing protein [Ignavibacteriales bacterium]|nr:LamG domain-containing protein [Ignavibacteriales bacterium]